MNLSDKQLIENYLNGDNGALELLIKRYLKYIYNFAYKNVGDQAMAEDVAQEVFIKVWKNIKKFDLKKEFKPWLFQVAKNTSIDYLRKRKTVPFSWFENEKGQNFLIETIATKSINLLKIFDDKRTLAIATQSLTVEDQKLLNLRHADEMSFKEISEIFKESVNTIKSRYRRIIINLRKNNK